LTLVSVGRVGRAHGRDGSFYVDRADHPLAEGTAVTVGGRTLRIERRAGTDERPLLRLAGVADPGPLKGERLLVEDELVPGEWLASELIGRRVEGLGVVRRVLEGPSCDLLELEDGTLVPFVSDAIRSIDDVIEVDREFLGL
jgi:16S rRNA processing protein RimM